MSKENLRLRFQAWPELRDACPYCWPGHDPSNLTCQANDPAYLIDVGDDEVLIRSGAQYDLMLCTCAPVDGWQPIHAACADALEAHMEFEAAHCD